VPRESAHRLGMGEARAILKNTGLLAGARIIERLSSLVLTFFIARKLGAGGLGVYSAAIAYYIIVAGAGELGVTNLLVREIAKDRSKTNTYLVHLSVLAVAASAVVVGPLVFILEEFGSGHQLVSAISIVLIAVCPGIVNAIQEGVFVAHQRVELQTYTTLVASLATVGISVALLEHGAGLLSLVTTFVVVEYLVTICYFVLTNLYVERLHWQFRWTTAVELVKEVKEFTAISILGAIFSRPEVVLLSMFATAEQVGYYSAALKVIDVWYFLPQTLMVNVFPVLSRAYERGLERVQALQDTVVKYVLACVLPLCVGTAASAGPLVRLLYGDDFGRSVLLLRLLSFNLIVYTLHSLFWRVLAARGEQGLVLRVQLFTTFARVGSGYGLIEAFGALGAAIAMPASLLFHTLLLGFYVRRDGTRIRGIWLAWRFAAAAACMGVAAWFAAERLDLLFVVPAGVGVYVGLALLFGAVSPHDYARLRVPLRRAAD
jgi:O-antigen/teichoic acid export membrane protein